MVVEILEVHSACGGAAGRDVQRWAQWLDSGTPNASANAEIAMGTNARAPEIANRNQRRLPDGEDVERIASLDQRKQPLGNELRRRGIHQRVGGVQGRSGPL
jgi:hypothetical protein